MCNYLDILFPGHADTTQEQNDAALAAAKVVEANRIAALHARDAAREAEKIANRCPKCMGEGRIAQFSHRKGGECFTCGGTGVFSKYSA
jgi:DnaJ-class molecular chaperone